MASLLLSGVKDSDVPIKAVEIQAATHQEIIALGDNVFQKCNAQQMDQFNIKMKQHESNLMKRLEEEKMAALEQLRIEHERSIENLKYQYTQMMDDALKEEADRMNDIMDRIATTTLEEEKLEGQRKLDESLKKAREDFDADKAEAIMQVCLEHEEQQNKIKKQMEKDHHAMINKLNREWAEKLKIQADKDLLHEHETLEYELEEAKRRFELKMEQALKEVEKEHAEEVEQLNMRIVHEKANGVRLKNNIDLLNISINDMKADLKNVLVAFQKFIDQTPGFSPGQSDFLLASLVPEGFDEFISSSY